MPITRSPPPERDSLAEDMHAAPQPIDNLDTESPDYSFDKISTEFNRRVGELQHEFNRQMQALQSLMISNIERTQEAVNDLRQEVRRAGVSSQPASIAIANDAVETNRESERAASQSFPTDTANVSQIAAAHVPRKIYPLPTFSGHPEEWQTFYEAFTTSTDDFKYSAHHNIMRLRDAIKGKARDTVESLLCNSRNVDNILKTLQETYGRPEQLIKSQLQKIRALPAVAEKNLDALVHFANNVCNMTAYIESVNGEHHLANPMLLSELIAKLPITKQMQWAEKCLELDRAPTVVDFTKWICNIRKLANIVSDALPSTSTATARSGLKQNSQSGSDGRGHKFACVSVASRCNACDGQCLSLSNCKTFLTLSVDNRWKIVKSKHLCFTCLKGGHRANKCYNKRKCSENRCRYFHHHLLHDSKGHPEEMNATSTDAQITNDHRNCHAEANYHEDAVLFQIIKVRLYGKENTVEIYAFVDDGANATMIDADVARDVGVTGRKDVLELQWLNKQTTREDTEIVELIISGVEENAQKFEMSKVFVSKSLDLPKQTCNVNELMSLDSNSHLTGLPLHSYAKVQPKMIISLTHAFLTVPIDSPRSSASPGPIAAKTRLGWVIYGPIDTVTKGIKRTSCHFTKVCDENEALDDLQELMKSYFETEVFGIRAGVKQVTSAADERALSILKSTTKRRGDRFESGLLWRKDDTILPASYQTALKRLEGTERKMSRDPQFASEYTQKIREYVDKGYARKLTREEAEKESRKTFYLPHFGVKNENKEGIRLVFDAAAESAGISLNKALLVGPDLNQSLISILFKFRQAPVAVCGDIKEMFHQVRITKEDQDAQRFLWRDGDPSRSPDIFIMQRMLFGIACSPTIAQYVKNSNALTFAEEYPRAVKGIIERHYVDDYVDCFRTEEEAIRALRETIMIQRAAGFEMHHIISNSNAVTEGIGSPSKVEYVRVENGRIERVLGLYWLPEEDEFVFKFKFRRMPEDILAMKRKPRKREMLSITMAVFDPFGFVQNFTVCGKILLQAVWKAGIQWDEPLPDSLYLKWQNWLKQLVQVEQFRIPRCYFPSFQKSEVELHVFCDASEEAMAAVAYWRIEEPNGARIVFVAGRTSCAPTKYQTIPRLELQAAVMAARLKNTIMERHDKNIKGYSLWSDSQTVIRWIKSDHRKYKQFVANRVSEILDFSLIENWRWCPGRLNPADEASRAKFPIRYNPNNLWKNGPEFLRQPRTTWPNEEVTEPVDDQEELKIKKSSFLTRHVSSIVPNTNNFSSFVRVSRVMAWVLRYLFNLMRAQARQQKILGELTADEQAKAERYLCRWMQQEAFAADYTCLAAGKLISRNSDLKALNPYMDDEGLMRVKGRLDNVEFLPLSARRPIILAKQHALTRLIATNYHRKLRHINTDTIIAEIRQKYWIPSIRSLLRSIQTNCAFCKIRRATAITPQMGCLPPDRCTPFVRAFSYTGLDYFGPINVTIGRRREKRWVALFTCLTIRAVHLEIATDLSSDACLLCIRNFINRRGVPVLIRSDSGTNFVGINKELRNTNNFLDEGTIKAGLAPLGINWKFNTPSHPSSGGAWERLVRSVKTALSAMLVENAPRLETFYSLLLEAENIVNSRPLTHIPITPEEPEPLTPNHFLLGVTSSTQTPAPYEPRHLRLRKQWQLLLNLKNGFWKRWIREYLPDLTRRTKWCLPKNPIRTGCLVLICEENAPRSQWRRVRVLRLYIGKDGICRSAEVQTSSGVLKRPVSKLAILDVEGPKGENSESSPRSVHGGGDVGNAVAIMTAVNSCHQTPS